MRWIYLICGVVISSCLSVERARLSHEDKPHERGADSPEPWHFHTGKGIRFLESTGETGEITHRETFPCDLTSPDAIKTNCRERVYFFSRSDIDQIVARVNQGLDMERDLRAAKASVAGLIAAISAKSAMTATALPPEPITKAGAVVGWVISAGAASYVIYQGTQIARIALEIRAIADFIEKESLFVDRCQHVRKDFLEEAAKLGIFLPFSSNGGQFIDAKDYQDSLRKERELYEEVSARALSERITTAEAYKKYFRDMCGQLPMVEVSRQDLQYKDPKNVIPEHIAVRARSVDEGLELLSRKPLYFAEWDSGDVYSNEQKDTLYRFLLRFREEIDRWKVRSPEAFQRFRARYQEIYITPRSKRWFGEAPPYVEVSDQGQTTLIVYLDRKGSFYAGYEADIPAMIKAWTQD